MDKQAPPSYEQSQSANPTFPNAGQVGFQPASNPEYKDASGGYPHPNTQGATYPGPGQPYPGAGQPYPGAGQPYPHAGQPYPNASQPYPAATSPYPPAGQPYQQPPVQQFPIQNQPYAMEMQTHPVNVPLMHGTQVPIIITTNQLGPHPTTVYCPVCKENVTSKTKTEAGVITWISCATLAFFGLWLGCCLIPFCLDCCQDVYHSCPNCKAHFGKYSRV